MLIDRPSMLKKVEREIAVMKALDHPHVLHLIDVYESSEFLYALIWLCVVFDFYMFGVWCFYFIIIIIFKIYSLSSFVHSFIH